MTAWRVIGPKIPSAAIFWPWCRRRYCSAVTFGPWLPCCRMGQGGMKGAGGCVGAGVGASVGRAVGGFVGWAVGALVGWAGGGAAVGGSVALAGAGGGGVPGGGGS